MGGFHLGEPVFLRNLIIYPIKNGSAKEETDIATIDDNLGANKGRFCELEVPDVNRIVFDNKGELPVLMIDGEEITGSLQNRIIARSTLIKAHTHSSIRVVCAEEGRWKKIGGFRTGYCSYPKIRSILATSLQKNFDIQREVWQEIERKLTVTRSKSQTSSMHEIYDNLGDEIDRYLEGFQNLNHHTIGFIGTAGNQILGCDIFGSSDIYQRFENKLLRSYALDAIEHLQKSSKLPEAKLFMDEIELTLNNIELMNRDGHHRLKGRRFSGQMLIYKKTPLHISAFPSSA